MASTLEHGFLFITREYIIILMDVVYGFWFIMPTTINLCNLIAIYTCLAIVVPDRPRSLIEQQSQKKKNFALVFPETPFPFHTVARILIMWMPQILYTNSPSVYLNVR